MTKRKKKKGSQTDNPAVTLPGTVEKLIPPIPPDRPEKAQIAVEGAEELYKELRVENTLEDEKGNEVGLKEGAKVDVTIEADPDATEPKKDAVKSQPTQTGDKAKGASK